MMTTGDSVIIDPRMRYTQMPASDAGTLIDPLCKRRTTPISTGCYFLSGNQLLLLIGCRVCNVILLCRRLACIAVVAFSTFTLLQLLLNVMLKHENLYSNRFCY